MNIAPIIVIFTYNSNEYISQNYRSPFHISIFQISKLIRKIIIKHYGIAFTLNEKIRISELKI